MPFDVARTTDSWPLFDVARTREHERAALASTPPHALMARAGLATARMALALMPHASRVLVLAGPGNNGGDGLVAARTRPGVVSADRRAGASGGSPASRIRCAPSIAASSSIALACAADCRFCGKPVFLTAVLFPIDQDTKTLHGCAQMAMSWRTATGTTALKPALPSC